MKVLLTDNAKAEYQHWKNTDTKIITRIQVLLEDIKKTPYKGIGKPEPLRHNLTGLWSRRITKEHRLVYAVEENQIIIYQCRFHYSKRKNPGKVSHGSSVEGNALSTSKGKPARVIQPINSSLCRVEIMK